MWKAINTGPGRIHGIGGFVRGVVAGFDGGDVRVGTEWRERSGDFGCGQMRLRRDGWSFA